MTRPTGERALTPEKVAGVVDEVAKGGTAVAACATTVGTVVLVVAMVATPAAAVAATTMALKNVSELK
ncbi:hypothetical protein Tco_1358764 [Tanacetum coccineum]